MKKLTSGRGRGWARATPPGLFKAARRRARGSDGRRRPRREGAGSVPGSAAHRPALSRSAWVPLPPPPARGSLCWDFMSVLCPLPCSDYLRSAEMTEVMMNTPAMDEIGLSPRKDGLSYQIFPDPSDFDRYCKLKDRLPSIVVEPTEGDVESGELRWPPEEFLVQEEDEEEEEENCEDAKKDKEQ
uniref:Protein LBH n=3 Tax=Passeriformes TaxID=9126 RepID=A0A8C3Y202_CATUS